MTTAVIFWQAIRYIAVGLANTAFGLLCIFACIFFFNFSDIAANFLGYAMGFLLSYLLHRSWTFRDTATSMSKSLPRFATVMIIAYVFNLLTVLVVHRAASINIYLAQVAGVCIYVTIGFIGSRYFAFQCGMMEKRSL